MHARIFRCAALALGFLAVACGSGSRALDPNAALGGNSNVDESNGAVIVSRTAPVPAATNASERILFLRAGSSWIMGPDGEEPEQLSVRSLEAPDQRPRMSPDSQNLVYASAKDGTLKLYVQAMDDLIPRAVTEGIDSEASWSPDGATLAFMRGDGRVNRDLYILDLASGDARLLLAGDDDHPELAGAPIFSADGKSIIMSADRREHMGTALWRVEVQSGTIERITPVPNGAAWTRDRSPALSKDGQRIAFASNRHASSRDSEDDFDIYSIALDGSGLTRLTDDPGTIADPVYSTDDSRIYFASTRNRSAGFEWEIYVMAATGGEQRRLTRDARPENYAPFVTSLPKAQ